MSAVSRQLIETVLRQFTDPHLNLDPVSAGCVREIDIQGGKVSVRLQVGYACGLFRSGWAQMLQMALENLDGVDSAVVGVDVQIEPHKAQGAGAGADQREEHHRRGLWQGRCGQIDHSRQSGPGAGP